MYHTKLQKIIENNLDEWLYHVAELLELYIFLCYFSLWLGLSDLDVKTVLGTPDGFTTPWVNWNSGQPTGNGGSSTGTDDCVVSLRTNVTLGKWNDVDYYELKVLL